MILDVVSFSVIYRRICFLIPLIIQMEVKSDYGLVVFPDLNFSRKYLCLLQLVYCLGLCLFNFCSSIFCTHSIFNHKKRERVSFGLTCRCFCEPLSKHLRYQSYVKLDGLNAHTVDVVYHLDHSKKNILRLIKIKSLNTQLGGRKKHKLKLCN